MSASAVLAAGGRGAVVPGVGASALPGVSGLLTAQAIRRARPLPAHAPVTRLVAILIGRCHEGPSARVPGRLRASAC